MGIKRSSARNMNNPLTRMNVGNLALISSTATFITSSGGTDAGITGGYQYRVFTTSANLTISAIATNAPKNLLEYIIVAGGGAGGATPSNFTGGGGAGGVVTGNVTLTSAQSIAIVIGAGASNYNVPQGAASNIFSPQISIVSATGGGAGGFGAAGVGLPGGSGGGGSAGGTGGLAVGSPGIGVAGTQGYPGGTSAQPYYYGGEGGGGRGGTNQSNPYWPGGPGNVPSTTWGGNGYTSPWFPSITSQPFLQNNSGTYYIAGGGGGGAKSASPGASSSAAWGSGYGWTLPRSHGGGGGNWTGSDVQYSYAPPAGVDGATNTGGGGGGGSFPNGPGLGGSGVVIIRYPIS
jgi:hypothetical protein